RRRDPHERGGATPPQDRQDEALGLDEAQHDPGLPGRRRTHVRVALQAVGADPLAREQPDLMGHAAMPSVEPAEAGEPSSSHAVTRAFDLLLAVPAVAVLAIPFAIVSALIRLTSRGPAFFRQERVGRDGRIFLLTKFRTMRAGPSESLVTA